MQEQEVRLILNRGQGQDLIASEFESESSRNLRSHVEVSSGCHDSGLAGVCQQMSHECYRM